jgi:CBS-domain-containing membrane protein
MPKTSVVERKKAHATTYKKSKPRVHIREVDAAKVRTEAEARGITRDELWEIRHEARLYGLFKGDPYKRAYMGGRRARRTRKN